MQEEPKKGSPQQMQNDNATGNNGGEQGRASYSTGSTTQGGSDFGQGSSHLGGESYRQGDTSNAGSNYENEKGRLGNSSVGTPEEGSSTGSDKDKGDSGRGSTLKASTNAERPAAKQPDTGREEESSRGAEEKKPKEGDRRDTELEKDTSLDAGPREDRSSGSWSKETI